MSGMQSEISFFTDFPSKETLKLLLEWQSLYSEISIERKKLSLISTESAIQLLDIPQRKLNQYIKEGFLKQTPDGRIYKYQVLQILFEVLQLNLYRSIK